MNNYQRYLYDKFEKFRQKPNWHPYPPYHIGDYLEERFIKYFQEKQIKSKRYFIPIAWNSCYVNNNDAPQYELQEAINSLNKDEKYFIVCTHDDAPREKFENLDVLCFSGGGNSPKSNISIPITSCKIPQNLINKDVEKKYLASFVGSITHPIRAQLINTHKNNPHYHFAYKRWNIEVKNDALMYFINKIQESYFGFDPRGYGRSSHRLYEIMQLGAVPIHISDNFWLPWSDELDWNEISILCKADEINIIDQKIKECMASGLYEKKKNKIKEIYENYFTAENIIKKIIEKVEKDE